jgi:hypothetical protein
MKKLRSLTLLAAILGSVAHAQETMIVDYDNQLNAFTNPTDYFGARWWHSSVDSVTSGSSLNIGWYNDATLQTASPNFNFSRTVNNTTSGFPVGNGNDNAYQMRFSMMALWDAGLGAPLAGRSTTRTILRSNFPTRASLSPVRTDLTAPALNLSQKFKFDVYSEQPIAMGIMVNEGAVPTQTIGVDGSATGPLEIIGGTGADQINASGQWGGFQIPAATWTTVTIDFSACTVRNFNAGNGTLDPVTPGWVSLNSICFFPATGQLGVPTLHTVYLDNFRQGDPVAGGTIAGNMDLSDWAGNTATLTGEVEVYSGTTLVATLTGPLAANGDFSMNTTVADGNYTLIANVKSGANNATWLKKKISATVAGGNATGANFVSMLNGDSVDDGVVDLSDYTAVATAFNGLLSDPNNGGNPSGNWNARADVSGDGVVDLTDYTAIAVNFNALDDQP